MKYSSILKRDYPSVLIHERRKSARMNPGNMGDIRTMFSLAKQRRGPHALNALLYIHRSQGTEHLVRECGHSAKDWKVRSAGKMLAHLEIKHFVSNINDPGHKPLVEMLPKSELHYHLDGGVNPATILDEAQRLSIDLRSFTSRLRAGYTTDDIRKIVSMQPGERFNASDFGSFLTDKFLLPLKVMQTPESLERISYEAILNAYNDGILHREIIFAPCLHTEKGLNYDDVIDAVVAGLLRGQAEFGVSSSIRPSIFRDKVEVKELHDHPLQTVQSILRAQKRYQGKMIIGLDLVGHEASFPPQDERYKTAFALANNERVPMSLHAGEMKGTRDNVFTIVNSLEASRVGHGIHVMDKPLSNLNWLDLKNITFEVCPTSNFRLGNILGEMNTHPILGMMRSGLNVTVNTDNPTVFGITLSEEFENMEREMDFRIFSLNTQQLERSLETLLAPKVSGDYRKLQQNALRAAFVSEMRREQLQVEFKGYYHVINAIAQILAPL